MLRNVFVLFMHFPDMYTCTYIELNRALSMLSLSIKIGPSSDVVSLPLEDFLVQENSTII